MNIPVHDQSLLGILLITPIFLGSVLLLIDLPIFNPVTPFSLTIAYLGLCLGLVFGLFSIRWYTKEQLKILEKNYEFKDAGSKKLNVAVYGGTAIFVVFSFFLLYFKTSIFAQPLANGLILFVISATFIASIIRMRLIKSWEKQEEKIVMMEWRKFYVIPYPPPNY